MLDAQFSFQCRAGGCRRRDCSAAHARSAGPDVMHSVEVAADRAAASSTHHSKSASRMGRAIERHVVFAKGAPENPLSDAELRAKVVSQVEPVLERRDGVHDRLAPRSAEHRFDLRHRPWRAALRRRADSPARLSRTRTWRSIAAAVLEADFERRIVAGGCSRSAATSYALMRRRTSRLAVRSGRNWSSVARPLTRRPPARTAS